MASTGDNHIRFSLLSSLGDRAGAQVFRPQIINIHDWQALVAPYLRHFYAHDPTFFGTKIVSTIHNLGYQGRFGPQLLPDIGLTPGHMRPDLMEFFGDINLLKGAIVYADWITTVSPTYAREIQTPQFGEGLEGLLSARANSLSGILNGVDYGVWNPESDRYIAQRFSADTLEGKRSCKLDLLREFDCRPPRRGGRSSASCRGSPGRRIRSHRAGRRSADGHWRAVRGARHGRARVRGPLPMVCRRTPGAVCRSRGVLERHRP
jgi:starch synthase